MKHTIEIQYYTRNGYSVRRRVLRCEVAARLAVLDEVERVTRECAPTDSGDIRFNALAEAEAIRTAAAIAED